MNDLAQTIWHHHGTSLPSKRTLVSISGVPGSGKSTLARHLAEKLNSLYLEHYDLPSKCQTSAHADLSNPPPHSFAIDVPMDGYHLSRAQLRALPDPETAIHRRGAAFTYDAAAYCQLVEQLAQLVDHETATIYAPAFDHATKEPVKASIKIGRTTAIVILEGNYVNLDRAPWRDAAELFDVKFMVMVDRLVAKQRLIKRHVGSGICADEESARARVEGTDDLNAEDILAHRVDGVLEFVL